MTTAAKPVTRITSATIYECGHEREVVVTVHPFYLELRLRGTRRSYIADIRGIYHAAVLAEVSRERASKKGKR